MTQPFRNFFRKKMKIEEKVKRRLAAGKWTQLDLCSETSDFCRCLSRRPNP
jgi:hypothetical protein